MVVVDAVVDTVEGTFHGLSLLIRHALYTRCIRYVYTACQDISDVYTNTLFIHCLSMHMRCAAMR